MMTAEEYPVECSKCLEHLAVIQTQERCVEDRRDLWSAMNTMRTLGYTLLGGMALALLAIIGNLVVARSSATAFNAHEIVDQMVIALEGSGCAKSSAGGGE